MSDYTNNGWQKLANEVVKRSTGKEGHKDRPIICFDFEEGQLAYFKDNGFYVEGTSLDSEAIDKARKSGLRVYNASIGDLRVLKNDLFPSGFCSTLGDYPCDFAQKALREMSRVCSRNLYLRIPLDGTNTNNYIGWLERQIAVFGPFEKIDLSSGWNPFSRDKAFNYAIRLSPSQSVGK